MDDIPFAVQPLDQGMSFKAKAYLALRQAIARMDIYGQPNLIRLDERQLCMALGVSRTPVREAMALLEQEGFIRSQPRRGIFVVRKTKAEIIDMITVCAALEGMAARLCVERASEARMHSLREAWGCLADDAAAGAVDAYSDDNVAFHQAIAQASDCPPIIELIERFFIHMQAIRRATMRDDGRTSRSVAEHREIMDALESRDADRAERTVRAHTLGLARHVERHGAFV